MLASLLPGLREVRTPLAVGYLWLLNIWLLLGGRITTAMTGKGVLVDRLDGLVKFFGQGAAVAAVSFAAFLLGSIVTIKPGAFSHLWTKLTGKRSSNNETQLFDFIIDSLEIKAIDTGNFAASSDRLFPVEDLRARLLVANQAMYGEYDRLEAEGVFRVNITFPLFILGVILTIESRGQLWVAAPLAILTLAVSSVLLAQGQGKNALATEVLTRSILSGVIQHPLVVDTVAMHDFKARSERDREALARRAKDLRDSRKSALEDLRVYHENLRDTQVTLADPAMEEEMRRSSLDTQKRWRDLITGVEKRLEELYEAD
jgi:hypothetical protein